jgi:hypothetical protein
MIRNVAGESGALNQIKVAAARIASTMLSPNIASLFNAPRKLERIPWLDFIFLGRVPCDLVAPVALRRFPGRFLLLSG